MVTMEPREGGLGRKGWGTRYTWTYDSTTFLEYDFQLATLTHTRLFILYLTLVQDNLHVTTPTDPIPHVHMYAQKLKQNYGRLDGD